MKAKIGIATILSFACTVTMAGNGSIGFTGRVVQPTVRVTAASMASDRDTSPLIASVHVENLMTAALPASPVLDYFVGYLRAAAAGAEASLIEITYN